jgi:hypothetical protein
MVVYLAIQASLREALLLAIALVQALKNLPKFKSRFPNIYVLNLSQMLLVIGFKTHSQNRLGV